MEFVCRLCDIQVFCNEFLPQLLVGLASDLDEFVVFFQKLGFRLVIRTAHHGGSAELQLPGPNQPIFEIHRASGEENIGINHIAFRVGDKGCSRHPGQSGCRKK